MMERGKRSRLALEAPTLFGIVGKIVRKQFQCYFAPEAGVAGSVDFAHSAGPEWSENLVSTEQRTPCKHNPVRKS
jgi:hypothetical protein